MHERSDGCSCAYFPVCDLEQRQMFDDSRKRAALMQVSGGVGGKEAVDPVMAVAHDAVAKQLADLLEGFLGLLARLGHGAIVCVCSDPRRIA